MDETNGKLEINPEDNIFTFVTLQTSIIQKLMSTLREIFVETNIIIRPDGIRILDMDKSNTIVVSMFLRAEEFELYDCKVPEIKIGVTMAMVAQHVHAAKSGYSLTMYLQKSKYCNGTPSAINLQIENGRGKCIDSSIKLIDTNSEEYTYPETNYDVELRMLTTDFQENIVIAANTNQQQLEIRAVGKTIQFIAKNTRSSTCISGARDKSENSCITWNKHSNKVVQGIFSIKGLKCFTQCTPMCSECDIALSNDAPIRVRYYPGTLGDLEFFHIPSPAI